MKADSTQLYLDLASRYAQGRIGEHAFFHPFRAQWAAEREARWQTARCANDCRFLRFCDRLLALSMACGGEELRPAVKELLTAYKEGKTASLPEQDVLRRPSRVAVFERPALAGWVYPCTPHDIRGQLARVPEWDQEGLWAVGLVPATRRNCGAYGTYYPWKRPMNKPVIFLHSQPSSLRFRLRWHWSHGALARCFAVELAYGMEVDQTSGRTVCRWGAECLRRYTLEHVLPHEIGHHVQYRQRWRGGHGGDLGWRVKEQFAEDYALRFCRQMKRS